MIGANKSAPVTPRFALACADCMEILEEATIPPDCLNDGRVVIRCPDLTCPRPEDVITFLPALGHDWGAWTQTLAPTCYAFGEQTRFCSRCPSLETEPLALVPHSFDGGVPFGVSCGGNVLTLYTCLVCAYIHIDGVLVGCVIVDDSTPATCETPGLHREYCQNCSYLVENVLPPLGHIMTVTVIPATCLTAGSRTEVCSRAGCLHDVTIILPPHGHDWPPTGVFTPATSIRNAFYTYTCTLCGAIREVEIPGTMLIHHGPVNITPITLPPPEEIEDDDVPLTLAESYAHELHALELFIGYGNDSYGNPIFGLDDPLNRIQALILTLRLLGLAEEAQAYTGSHPFTDISGWQVPYVAFAYARGITIGVSDDRFAPDRPVTTQQFTTFLLRSLLYDDLSDDPDFEFATAINKALTIGMYTPEILEEINNMPFMRGDAVIAMVRALLTYINDDFEDEDGELMRKLLINFLVGEGLFTMEEAAAFISSIRLLDEIRASA